MGFTMAVNDLRHEPRKHRINNDLLSTDIVNWTVIYTAGTILRVAVYNNMRVKFKKPQSKKALWKLSTRVHFFVWKQRLSSIDYKR